MATVTLLFGVQFMMMGVVAEYLYRVFSESTRRPLYFIRGRIEVGGAAGGRADGGSAIWLSRSHGCGSKRTFRTSPGPTACSASRPRKASSLWSAGRESGSGSPRTWPATPGLRDQSARRRPHAPGSRRLHAQSARFEPHAGLLSQSFQARRACCSLAGSAWSSGGEAIARRPSGMAAGSLGRHLVRPRLQGARPPDRSDRRNARPSHPRHRQP